MNEQSIISQNEIIVVFISHNYMVTFFIILQVKEWLCLNCQMQRAPEPTVVKPGTQTTKLPPPASPKKQDTVVAEDQKRNASAKQEANPIWQIPKKLHQRPKSRKMSYLPNLINHLNLILLNRIRIFQLWFGGFSFKVTISSAHCVCCLWEGTRLWFLLP